MIVVVLFGVGMPLVCNLIGFVPPALMSINAVVSTASASAEERAYQKKNWLTYWVVFGVFGAVETFLSAILFFVPFYFAFKVAILIW